METCIFFNGNGNIPAHLLASLIYRYEAKIVRVTADTEWEDGSAPQIRFELDIDRDEADTLVSELNNAMCDAGLEDEWWLGDE